MRRRLSKYLFLTYNIKVNPRTLGNYMKRLNLFTFVRRKKRQKEHKNTNVKFADLVQRDYNSKNNTIYATDVTYIPAPKDINQNHIYLSAIIDHKTKFVTYEISLNNDTELALNNIKNTKFKDNFILHTDHSFAYSSIDYINKIKSLNGKISMSRIGNNLDNREIEYFFSILKSEIFPHFSMKCQQMNFDELSYKISVFVNWYNYKRIRLKCPKKFPCLARTWISKFIRYIGIYGVIATIIVVIIKLTQSS
ncbi:IS3 family transposase [Mycoplasmopsis cynos]|nr:IS3 family transposase [Mycoplasmopsis cynos]